MAQRGAESVPTVDIPSRNPHAPSWARVGTIAVLGFIVGVAWPRLAGVRLGPSLPEGAASPVAVMSSAAPTAPAADTPSVGAAPVGTVLSAPVVSAPSASAGPPAASQGLLKTVQVEWDVALVRDAPKTGKVIARLPRGTSIRIGPAKDGWYPVKFGSDFAGEGWVYRGAIGR